MRIEKSVHDNGRNTRPIKIFLSYSYKDKKEAGKIQKKLRGFDMDVFVSHEDILTGKDWTKDIIENIEGCECFVPLISRNYHGANYTEQEFGMVMAMDKNVFPITFDRTDPIGFGARYQCQRLEPETSLLKLIESIMNEPPGHEYKDWIIDRLSGSKSYAETNVYALEIKKWLDGGYHLTPQQANRIIQASSDNSQVGEEFVMRNVLAHIKND